MHVKNLAPLLWGLDTHTHTHTHIYIYIYSNIGVVDNNQIYISKL